MSRHTNSAVTASLFLYVIKRPAVRCQLKEALPVDPDRRGLRNGLAAQWGKDQLRHGGRWGGGGG